MLLAECQAALSITLGDLEGIIDVVDGHVFIRYVANPPRPTPSRRSADISDGASGQTLIRAPSEALCMLMLLTMTDSTMSNSPTYWPRLPTLIPCDPLQKRDCTKMLVLFGLKETQSVTPKQSV